MELSRGESGGSDGDEDGCGVYAGSGARRRRKGRESRRHEEAIGTNCCWSNETVDTEVVSPSDDVRVRHNFCCNFFFNGDGCKAPDTLISYKEALTE
jgi:hypothetical protein